MSIKLVIFNSVQRLFLLLFSAIPIFAQLQTTPSWIGNSFSGPSKWVQSQVFDAFVTKDGTVYTNSVWDEGGREAGIYKDGDVVGMAGSTHGAGQMGGRAITSNSTYLYLAAG